MYHFLGPYTITNALPGGVYQLSDAEGNVSRATGGHLKLYQTMSLMTICQRSFHQALLSTLYNYSEYFCHLYTL